jgi:hypothetical protein
MNAANRDEERQRRDEERKAERKARNEKIPINWQIVKVEEIRYAEEWAKENRVTSCGRFYLYDRNRHVHICSFTPSYELTALEPYVLVEEGVSEEEYERIETEWREAGYDDSPVDYFDVSDVERMPSQPLGWAPEREEGEDSETYYTRACEEIREQSPSGRSQLAPALRTFGNSRLHPAHVWLDRVRRPGYCAVDDRLRCGRRRETRALREGDGCLPEADSELNDASRNLIETMAEAGETWLGRINLHGEERGRPECAVWKHRQGDTIYNFGADFALPCFDSILQKLILERDASPYTTAKADCDRIEVIMARIREVGGKTLVWT